MRKGGGGGRERGREGGREGGCREKGERREEIWKMGEEVASIHTYVSWP